MNRRLEILKYWFLGKNNGVSFYELSQKLLDFTCGVKAKMVIKDIVTADSHIKIYFKDIEQPLFYPIAYPIHSLYQIIGESFYKDNWHYYEIEETKVKENDIVLDCGAAEGLFSLLIAKRCKKVYAVEPMIQFVEAMRQTFSLFTNVEIFQCALADTCGEAKIYANDISSFITNTDSVEGTVINVTTIDDLFLKKGIAISYIKADLEGYEQKMLLGAINTIKTLSPKLAITTYHKPEDARQISEFLRRINPNYKIKLKGIDNQAGAPVMLHAWI